MHIEKDHVHVGKCIAPPPPPSSAENDKIPDELWNMFPPNGQYLKNILMFTGYETYHAVMKLKQENEIKRLFSFVKDMSDIIDYKKKMFGIFSKHPEKVMLLPGLESVLSKCTFIRDWHSFTQCGWITKQEDWMGNLENIGLTIESTFSLTLSKSSVDVEVCNITVVLH